MAKHFISKKELKSLKQKVESLGLDSGILKDVQIEEIKEEKCYFIDKRPFVYERDGDEVIPTLFLLNELKPEKSCVSVDDGAVPHVMNGANVFAQGITFVDPEVAEGDLVFVKNKDDVFIAVGIAGRSASEIMNDKKGEAVRLIHFPNDKIFKTFYK